MGTKARTNEKFCDYLYRVKRCELIELLIRLSKAAINEKMGARPFGNKL